MQNGLGHKTGTVSSLSGLKASERVAYSLCCPPNPATRVRSKGIWREFLIYPDIEKALFQVNQGFAMPSAH